MHVIAISSCFGALSTVFVLLRLYTRFYLIRHPGIDDYIITLALVRYQAIAQSQLMMRFSVLHGVHSLSSCKVFINGRHHVIPAHPM